MAVEPWACAQEGLRRKIRYDTLAANWSPARQYLQTFLFTDLYYCHSPNLSMEPVTNNIQSLFAEVAVCETSQNTNAEDCRILRLALPSCRCAEYIQGTSPPNFKRTYSEGPHASP